MQKGQIPFDLGIVRIEPLRAIERRDGRVNLSKLGERQRLVDERHDEVRLQGEGLVEPGKRLVVGTKRLQRGANVVAGDRIDGIKHMCPLVIGQRLLESSQVVQHMTALLEHTGAVGLQLLAQIEAGKSRLHSPEIEQEQPASVGRLAIARIELESLTIGKNSLIRPLQFRQYAREVFPACRVVRLELHGLCEGLPCLVEVAKPLQGGAERGDIVHLRRLPDRADEPLDRMIVLACLERQQPRKMQCVGVSSIDCERLLAAELRVEMAAGLHVPAAKFIERTRR